MTEKLRGLALLKASVPHDGAGNAQSAMGLLGAAPEAGSAAAAFTFEATADSSRPESREETSLERPELGAPLGSRPALPSSIARRRARWSGRRSGGLPRVERTGSWELNLLLGMNLWVA